MSEPKPACCNGELKDEIFYFLGYAYVFDVDRANRMVRDGREPVEVEEESVRYCVETSDLVHEHIAHVNADRPGIIAHVAYESEQGERITGHVLIDGNHRAARCLQLGRPFYAYVLDAQESEQILVQRPATGALDAALVPAEEAGA
jgi:hypothetical protein